MNMTVNSMSIFGTETWNGTCRLMELMRILIDGPTPSTSIPTPSESNRPPTTWHTSTVWRYHYGGIHPSLGRAFRSWSLIKGVGRTDKAKEHNKWLMKNENGNDIPDGQQEAEMVVVRYKHNLMTPIKKNNIYRQRESKEWINIYKHK